MTRQQIRSVHSSRGGGVHSFAVEGVDSSGREGSGEWKSLGESRWRSHAHTHRERACVMEECQNRTGKPRKRR